MNSIDFKLHVFYIYFLNLSSVSKIYVPLTIKKPPGPDDTGGKVQSLKFKVQNHF